MFFHIPSRNGIAHEIEIENEKDWGSPDYGLNTYKIWIYEEDHLKEVADWFQLYVHNPQDPLFQHHETNQTGATQSVPPTPPKGSLASRTPIASPWDKQPIGWITKLILGLCCILFFFSQFSTPSGQIPRTQCESGPFSTSPIEKALLFDYPKFYELINRFIRLYGYEA